MTTENMTTDSKPLDIVYVVSIGDENTYSSWTKKSLITRDVIEVRNNEANSIFSKYNLAIDSIKDIENKIVIFVHEDIKLNNLDYSEVIVRACFNQVPTLGVLGVYGVNSYVEQGGWWMCNRKMNATGRIVQGLPNGSFFLMQDNPKGFVDDLVMVDGCYMAIRGSLLKQQRFAAMDGYHFYDASYCISVIENTDYTVGVNTDILVTHKSEGPVGEAWSTSRDSYINKLKEKYEFPITVEKIRSIKNGNINTV